MNHEDTKVKKRAFNLLIHLLAFFVLFVFEVRPMTYTGTGIGLPAVMLGSLKLSADTSCPSDQTT